MNVPVLRPAHPGEAEALSALALRSKGHWGYSAEFLEACRDELTLTEEELAEVTVAECDGAPVGFSRLVVDGHRAELTSLFVDPPWIGSGFGAALMTAVLDAARSQGVTEIGLDADPGAETFYAHFGARTEGTSPSGSIPGRLLPRMVLRPTTRGPGSVT